MKGKFIQILTILLAIFTFWGCTADKSVSSENGDFFDEDASYALGMSIGMDLEENISMAGISINIDQFVKGINDYLSGGKTRFSIMEANDKIEAAFTALMEASNVEAMQSEIAFLAENGRRPDVMITPSGLQYEIITETNGPKPSIIDTVRVHYMGELVNGFVFDGSFQRGEPVEFALYEVISGWTEGLQLMSIGSKYRFYIPSELGYGATGWNEIPPFAVLIFEVELLDIITQE